MQKRVQSPSSIKIYKQCPRKYYYQYIEKIEAPPNVHQVRGNIAHSVLENFFDANVSKIPLEDCEAHLKLIVQELLVKEWNNYKPKLDQLNLTHDQTMFYFEDTLMMLLNWTEQFCGRVARQAGTFQERFQRLTPIREQRYLSDNYFVQGFIDAIESNGDGTVRLMDYKTSSNQDLNEHMLQLAIYSLLYSEKHGQLPKHVGCYFLKGTESTVEVDEALLEMAKKEIQKIHLCTTSKDIKDYPRSPGPLCKWSTGQCEYYHICKPFG